MGRAQVADQQATSAREYIEMDTVETQAAEQCGLDSTDAGSPEFVERFELNTVPRAGSIEVMLKSIFWLYLVALCKYGGKDIRERFRAAVFDKFKGVLLEDDVSLELATAETLFAMWSIVCHGPADRG